jgi:peroxiredoxin
MKNFLLATFVAISFMACQQKNYTIEGTIEGVTEGQAILQKIIDGKPTPIDTAVIAEGKFTFTGSEEEPQIYLIFVDKNRTPIMFFGENKHIIVTADDETKLNDAKIEGSPITDILTKFTEEVPEQGRMNELNEEYQKARMTSDKEKMEAIAAEANELMQEQKAYFIQFIKDNTDNVVGANMALNAMREFEMDEFKELVAQFESNLGEHQYVAKLKEALEQMEKAEEMQKEAAEKKAAAEKATSIGAIAPDFTLETVDGEQLSLSSLKGKYVLVDFWASWCKPCRNENPNVVKAYKKFNAKGFDVLSVSLDKDSVKWKEAIKADGLVWNQVIDSKGDIAQVYGVQGIPFTLLLDKEGKIVEKNLRGEALEEKLTELLN